MGNSEWLGHSNYSVRDLTDIIVFSGRAEGSGLERGTQLRLSASRSDIDIAILTLSESDRLFPPRKLLVVCRGGRLGLRSNKRRRSGSIRRSRRLTQGLTLLAIRLFARAETTKGTALRGRDRNCL